MIDVPAEVRQKAAAGGAEGARWLRWLGAAIESLERDWGVVVGPTLRGGSDAYVAEATTRDGALAVLKLALPGEWASHQIETLLLAGGRGYVRVIEHDHVRQAMLLERLGPSLAALGLPAAEQIEIVCSTLRRAWSVAPDPRFQTGAEKARALAEFIGRTWRALGEPCPERVVERALSYAAARAAAFDPDRAVLVHGDAHGANTLCVPGDEREFKLIDPDGLFAEPACDLAVPMREWSGDLHERCAWLSRLTGVDPQPIWEWGFVERVSTGLLALDVGREQLGREMLAVADAFC